MDTHKSTNGTMALPAPGPAQGTVMQTYRALTPAALKAVQTYPKDDTQTSPELISKARQLLEEGRITREPGTSNTWSVVSLRDQKDKAPVVYRIDHDGRCSCKAPKHPGVAWPCYHKLGVALYSWVEKDLRALGLSMFVDEDAPGARAEEAPVDEDGQKATQDAPQATITANTINGIGASGEHNCGAARGQNEAYPGAAAHTPLLSDLTPVALPGGGERTRSMGQLMAALARAQQRMKNPAFDKQGQVGNIKTRFASTPAMRNEIIPALSAEAIGVLQYVYQTEHGMRCMTTLGHRSGEYVCVPLDVPHSGTTLTERGKTVGFVKRWALQTTVVLFGEDEAEGMEDLKQEPRQTPASVPDMASAASQRRESQRPVVPNLTPAPSPEEVAREYVPRLEAAIKARHWDVEEWFQRGEQKFHGTPRSKWGAPQYEYLLRWVKAAHQGQKATAGETA